ncbi:hypothetical protein GF378_03055 [Candidatus Pacearchaeota archaeon]|nr:hypothetical protein [Candidatus Pacearchaeota archaeon]
MKNDTELRKEEKPKREKIEKETSEKKELALVYMVAGISSRFGGKIKQFAVVGEDGETLIERSLKQALPAGFTKIIFIVGNKTEKPFKEKFGDEYQGVPVYYALQNYDPEKRERPWGTTDAICAAKDLIDCPFVLVNGDDLYGENSFKIIADFLKESEDESECATLGYDIMKVLPENGSTNRGIFETENDYVKNINEVFKIEKDKLSEKGLDENSLCSMNIFGLRKKVLNVLDEILDNFKQENQGDKNVECLLPVELSKLIDEGIIKMKLLSTPDKWFGVTNPGDEKVVQEQLRKMKDSEK